MLIVSTTHRTSSSTERSWVYTKVSSEHGSGERSGFEPTCGQFKIVSPVLVQAVFRNGNDVDLLLFGKIY